MPAVWPPGGLNYDAKVRRESTHLSDLFVAHIGGMDAFARGLIIADRILNDARYQQLLADRYRSFDGGDGARYERGELGLAQLRDLAAAAPEPACISGRQEWVENLINDHIVRGC